jgi:hypothetical protein
VFELIIIPICSLLLGLWFSLGNFITNPRKDHIVEMKTKKNVPTINSLKKILNFLIFNFLTSFSYL